MSEIKFNGLDEALKWKKKIGKYHNNMGMMDKYRLYCLDNVIDEIMRRIKI